MVKTGINIIEILSEVHDPEIPVLNIVEMGIVRSIEEIDNSIIIKITPTYSGCPAMDVIKNEIESKLKEYSIKNFNIVSVLTPVWTTDFITDDAKEKLLKYGISPPVKAVSNKKILKGDDVPEVICPQCRKFNTEQISLFGSTPCKSLYKCNDCLETFDYFKCF
jgi:ring-1,2-phenylacetyl-CoA epoxidase subunit PaaD